MHVNFLIMRFLSIFMVPYTALSISVVNFKILIIMAEEVFLK